MTPERHQKICRVLDQRQPDLTVITDEVHKGQNLSAITRTCDAVGIQTVHAVYPRGGFRPHTGTALGSTKWVDTVIHRSIEAPILQLQNQGYQIIAANFTDNAIDYRNVDYTLPTALLLGAEKWGVSSTAEQLTDINVTIPMLGMVESFNVSVACALILAEARQQREKKGCYDKPRLDESVRKKLFFEWAHPAVTRYCQKYNLAYPQLDNEGEIVNWKRQPIAELVRSD